MSLKKLTSVETAGQHWVGDGFPVRSLLDPNGKGKLLSPFIFCDYAGPYKFGPGQPHRPRGVGFHPHRGFETVTIAYQGEVAHKDSHGGGGIIGTGDVQWMTAGGGVMHEEMHSEKFTKEGGIFEMVQLWVNLPAKDKMTKPHYQALLNDKAPETTLPHGEAKIKVYAGEVEGVKGTAKTYSPLQLYDVIIPKGNTTLLKFPENWVVGILVRRGPVTVGGKTVEPKSLAIFDRENDTISVKANEEAALVVMAAKPLDEPIVGYGPFVMNTQKQIMQAFEDFEKGKFGSPQ